MHASPQVTAAQVLDAGRRAEADGRVDYAVQFYRHLADNHASEPEGQIAREALSRLKRFSEKNAPGTNGQKRAVPPPLRTFSHNDATKSSTIASRSSRRPIRLAPVGRGNTPRVVEVSEFGPAYVVGRLIAHGFAVTGTILILAGLIAAAIAAFLPAEAAAKLPVWLVTQHPFVGLIAAFLGIGLIFSGQIARAVFDMAEASRELAAIERARMEQANV